MSVEYLRAKIDKDKLCARNHKLLAPIIDDVKELQFAVLAGDSEARNDLALALFKRGKWQRAVEELEKCLPSPLAHKNLAAVYAARGVFDKAQKHALKAVQLAPNDCMAHRNLARIADTLGDSRTAVKHNMLAIQIQPKHPDAYRRLAIQRVGRGESGHAHYDAYRALTNQSYSLPTTQTTKDLLLRANQPGLML